MNQVAPNTNLSSDITTDFDTWVQSVERMVISENIIGFNVASIAPEINHLIIETKRVVGYMLKPVATLNGKVIQADQHVKIDDINQIRDIHDCDIALYFIISRDGYTAVRYAIVD